MSTLTFFYPQNLNMIRSGGLKSSVKAWIEKACCSSRTFECILHKWPNNVTFNFYLVHISCSLIVLRSECYSDIISPTDTPGVGYFLMFRNTPGGDFPGGGGKKVPAQHTRAHIVEMDKIYAQKRKKRHTHGTA